MLATDVVVSAGHVPCRGVDLLGGRTISRVIAIAASAAVVRLIAAPAK
jgi:hypothetical protein